MRTYGLVKHLLLITAALVSFTVCSALAQSDNAVDNQSSTKKQMKITPAQWKAAAASLKAKRDAKVKAAGAKAVGTQAFNAVAATSLVVDPVSQYYIPDYFETPNWANSPPLAKFVNPLPGLYVSGVSSPPAPGSQYIPVGVPDTTTYANSDYYEIELGEYTQLMHPGMSPTTLRGYRQTNTTDPLVSQFHYLGPIIIATKGRPVRIKFTNNLPTGDLFLPVDTTIMGSGEFQIDYNPETKLPMPLTSGVFSQARATLHLHGGLTPWISDGTAHQWTAPVGDATTAYPKGVSVAYVPDMWFTSTGSTIGSCAGQTTCAVAGATNDPGRGKLTFFWTNEQSARFMFYHDHAYGITRLNVYAGEAAGYLINDPATEDSLAALGVPGTIGTTPATTDLAHLLPLVIQDKTFVNSSTVLTTDPTWAWGSNPAKPSTSTPVTGDLWWPHVYMPAQNDADITGINAFGRWHYGPWFFPPTPVCGSSPQAVPPYCITNGPVPNEYYAMDPNCFPTPNNACIQNPFRPGTPNPSWGAEAFLDTMVVNGAVYPTVTVQPQKYRMRILNAAHDRFLNLQLYQSTSIIGALTLTNPGGGYTSDPAVTITGTNGKGATAKATADLDPLSPTFGQIIALNLETVGSGYQNATVTFTGGGGIGATATATVYSQPTEVGMVPAVPSSGFPENWPRDGREGGVPDPITRGPSFVQIGTEGGVLPLPVALPNQPIQWNTDPTMFNVGNVLQQRDGGGTLMLGPAERADVIVDFTKYSGKTIILYNDAPTAFPALDPHYDYYTGAPDRTDMGAYGPIPPGVGPNIRTVMQIVVAAGGDSTAPPNDFDPTFLSALANGFATPTGIFASTQHPIVAGQTAYDSTYSHTFPSKLPNWGVSRIKDTAISFETVNPDFTFTVKSNFPMERKAIHDEMGATFDDFGRMSAKLGLEVPYVNAANQNFILGNFVDPPTEIVEPNKIQIWRITHNGVDTHPIHFHLFDVQVLNRVGWDGFIRLPDDNELGWKDTVRISPLEDTIVALRPVLPPAPFPVPNSIRPMNPTTPIGSTEGFSQLDIVTGNGLVPPLTNQLINFGWEYTWHCHILSHEENDMMRVVSFAVPPVAPSGLSALLQGPGVDLSWTDNSSTETHFTIQRAVNSAFTIGLTYFTVNPVAGNPQTYRDTTILPNTAYYYRVQASNAVGSPVGGYPQVIAASAWSNSASIGGANLVQALITHYYNSILGRPPDAGGLTFWNAEIERIVSLGVDIKEGYISLGKWFFNSSEYIAMGTSNAAYVSDLYETFLNRTASQTEINFWSAYLTQGVSRNEVLNEFVFSAEFNTYMENLFGPSTTRPENNLINDYYRGILSRLPDTPGFNYWLPILRAAQCTGAQQVQSVSYQIVSSFIAGAEYVAKARTNTGYIEDLYDAFLRRGASPAEINGWLDQLTSGTMTRNQVLQFFIASPEFQTRVTAVINAGCLP
jgi:FtsP/CotA-like multicopper oxidase with cupredoxin domain